MKSLFRRLLLPLLLVLFYLWSCRVELVHPYLLPHPDQMSESLIRLVSGGAIFEHIRVSLLRVCLGFCITLMLAFPMAVLFHFLPRIREYLAPSLHFLKSVPPLAMVPLFILWFGIGETSKLALIVAASFFPLFLNIESGLEQVDEKLVEMGKSLDLEGWELFYHIYLSEALPSILTGMRLSFGYSWRALIGAEMIAASSGLGYLILDAQEMARTGDLFVGLACIGGLGLLLDSIALRSLRSFFPWMKGEAV